MLFRSSLIISVGNQIDMGFVDYLGVVASDPHTRAIILYVEEIREGREFLAAVRQITEACKAKNADIASSGIVHWSSASREAQIDEVIRCLSAI